MENLEIRKKYERVKYPMGFAFYKNHDSIPIEEVARQLGLDVIADSRGLKMRCPCPNHNDEHSSVTITTSGKYENTFKCWSCGESGGPLELVMAVRDGMLPSVFKQTAREGTREEKHSAYRLRDEAAKYLDTMFPGGIVVENEGMEEQSVFLPRMPEWMEKKLKEELGIDRFPKNRTVYKQVGDNLYQRDIYDISPVEYHEMVLDKLSELSVALKNRQFEIFKDFPLLDAKAKAYLMLVTDNQIEEIEAYQEDLRKYCGYLRDKENVTPFQDEIDSEFPPIIRPVTEFEPEGQDAFPLEL